MISEDDGGSVAEASRSSQLVGIGSFEWIKLVRRVEFPQPGKHDPPSVVTKCLALLLATYADTKTGQNIRPSRELLARVSGSNVRTISRATKLLTDAGLLECVKRASSGGRGGSPRAAVYRLTMPDDLSRRVRVLDAKEKEWMSFEVRGGSDKTFEVAGNELPGENNQGPSLPNELPILPESSASIGNLSLHSHLHTISTLQGPSVSSLTNAHEDDNDKPLPFEDSSHAGMNYDEAKQVLQRLADFGGSYLAIVGDHFRGEARYVEAARLHLEDGRREEQAS